MDLRQITIDALKFNLSVSGGGRNNLAFNSFHNFGSGSNKWVKRVPKRM